MKYDKFEKRVKPLLKLMQDACEEEGIAFLGRFSFDDDQTYYTTQLGDIVLDATDIITMVQHWEARNNKKLFPPIEHWKAKNNKKDGNTYNITINAQNTENKFAQELAEQFIKCIKEKGVSIETN